MYQQNNKIKAAVLLLVFLLNTVVSFACSVGIQFTLNEGHHEHAATHSHDKPNPHEGASNHSHESASSHSHESTTNVGHDHGEAKSEKECCSDEVVKFVELDKSVTHANQNPLPLPVELMAALYTFLVPDYSAGNAVTKPKHPANRSWALANHTDLRIVIQSFQI